MTFQLEREKEKKKKEMVLIIRNNLDHLITQTMGYSKVNTVS